MKRYQALFLSLLTAGSLMLSHSQAGYAQDKLETKYDSIFSTIDNLSVDFTQSTYKKLRNKTTVRSGDALFSKPGMFRWNFTSDKTGLEEYYFNGERLTHYREKENLVNHYNTNAGLARELKEVVSLVLDPKALFARYKVKSSKTANQKTMVTLEPKSKDGTDIETINVQVEDTQKFVEDVQIFYNDGNNTRFSFKNPKKAKNEPNVFIFSRKGNYTVRHHG
ncbi:MAG: outer membrane lipoprotein carrier protein LolA [Proteobacteria bacterium]|nr:MAG: outer membrane lipoprotein carrier protein LolA [Pseudomonadota bacterium]